MQRQRSEARSKRLIVHFLSPDARNMRYNRVCQELEPGRAASELSCEVADAAFMRGHDELLQWLSAKGVHPQKAILVEVCAHVKPLEVIKFFEFTKHPTWRMEDPLERWRGVECDEQGRIVELSSGRLSKMFVEPEYVPLLPCIGQLRSLQQLDLSLFFLEGPLPAELSQLTALRILNLSSNKFSGPIPDNLSALTNLVDLRLADNKLSGPIPEWIGTITTLEVLDLSSNCLTRTLPASLGELTNLRTLHLSDNELRGSFPKTFSQLVSLEHLNVAATQIGNPTGTFKLLRSLPNIKSAHLSHRQTQGASQDSLRRAVPNCHVSGW